MKFFRSIGFILFQVAIASGLFYIVRNQLEAHSHYEIRVILPILLDIAFLAFLASFGSTLSKALHIAPMAGKIGMGIVAGPALFGVLDPYAHGVEIARLAGVLFILFEAGLHFNMQLLREHLGIAAKIAIAGVIVPLISFGFLGYYCLDLPWTSALFLGGIFTATSVGLSVGVLKAVGKLQTELANKIIGAAVIDDILGVLVLTILSTVTTGSGHVDLLHIIGILVAVCIFVSVTYGMWQKGAATYITKYIDTHFVGKAEGSYTRLFFGALIISASITAIIGLEPVLGAFGIGVVLSKVDVDIKRNVWKKIEGYMHIFVGGFLVSIGTLLPQEAVFQPKAWGYALLFTLIAFLSKYIVRHFLKDPHEGHLVGAAMSIRGEVGLVFVAVAISNNILGNILSAAALLAVILVTILGAIVFEKRMLKGTNMPLKELDDAM